MLTLICHSQCYSQENSKGLSLKVKDLKTVEKNGKSSWALKATLTNHSRDTLFYFSTVDCEPAYFMAMAMADSINLFSDFEKCNVATQTVIAIPPSGQRIIDLVISSTEPMASSFKFKVLLSINRAKNINERIPHDLLVRGKDKDKHILLVSNRIKT